MMPTSNIDGRHLEPEGLVLAPMRGNQFGEQSQALQEGRELEGAAALKARGASPPTSSSTNRRQLWLS